MDVAQSYLENRGPHILRRTLLLVDARHGPRPMDIEVMKVLDHYAVTYQVRGRAGRGREWEGGWRKEGWRGGSLLILPYAPCVGGVGKGQGECASLTRASALFRRSLLYHMILVR